MQTLFKVNIKDNFQKTNKSMIIFPNNKGTFWTHLSKIILL